MDHAKHDNDLKEMRRRNRGLSLAVGGLLSALLLCLVIILNLIGTERTVVVPPSIDKTFWVTRDHASRAYLEQMGSFIAWLILDVTPASIDWKKDVLLNYVAPEQHGAMKSRQEIEAERLKRINASTYFLPQQLIANESEQNVVVRGRLRTMVNGQETATETKAYLVEFQYAGGRMHLKSFKEEISK
jgi:conjugal transfer pilus assembly protein TraE